MISGQDAYGFASKVNLADIKELKIKDVRFSEKRRMKTEDMRRIKYDYRKLWQFIALR